jgi:hypothetical protein
MRDTFDLVRLLQHAWRYGAWSKSSSGFITNIDTSKLSWLLAKTAHHYLGGMSILNIEIHTSVMEGIGSNAFFQ